MDTFSELMDDLLIDQADRLAAIKADDTPKAKVKANDN